MATFFNPHSVESCLEAAFMWSVEDGMRELKPATDCASTSIMRGELISGDATTAIGTFITSNSRYKTVTWSVDDMTSRTHDWGIAPGFTAISEAGDVLVGASYGPHLAARWTVEGEHQSLGVLPIQGHTESYAFGVSHDGQVILGTSALELSHQINGLVAFVWDERNGMRELEQVLIDEYGMDSLEDLALGSANSISKDRTRIVTTENETALGSTSLIKLDWPIGPPTDDGDMNFDNVVDATDINLQMQAIRQFPKATFHDLDFSGSVDNDDLEHLIKTTLNTWFGDANLDGQFNSRDMVDVFLVGQYEDGITGNSGWAEGDWNADGEFTSSDFIVAFADGGYEQGPLPVPEPSGLLLALVGLLMVALVRSETQRR